VTAVQPSATPTNVATPAASVVAVGSVIADSVTVAPAIGAPAPASWTVTVSVAPGRRRITTGSASAATRVDTGPPISAPDRAPTE
jgi:hypothetical protein